MGDEIGSAKKEDEEIPTYGTSLPVESVQEIVRRDPTNIPERYLRNHEPSSNATVLHHLSSEIPVIDLSLISKLDEHELHKLDMACQQWGFFQIINHGIEADVLQKLKAHVLKFFELPLEEKNKYAMASDDIQGYGHAYVVDEEQKLDWADLLILLVYPAKFRKSRYWPPELIEAIEVYSKEAKRVGEEVLGGLSLLLGMDKDDLLKLHNEIVQGMRVNYYPTCCRPNEVVGITPHSDTSSVTVLLQDDEIAGLQIWQYEGWVPVKPMPNTIVLNVGDVIEVFSNGRYKSIEHRAMTNDSRPRISIASFIIPHDDVEIEPLKSCQQDVKRYKKMRYADYVRDSFTKKLDGKSQTKLIKLETQ